MRGAGVVEGERVGRAVRYRLADPDIVRACGLMRNVLQRRVMRLAQMYGVAASDEVAEKPEMAAMGCPAPT